MRTNVMIRSEFIYLFNWAVSKLGTIRGTTFDLEYVFCKLNK